MREILFKAKRLDNGEWVEGAYCPKNGNGDIPCIIATSGIYEGCWFEIDPKTVCQYTGLKDMDGKKIFEGDILKHAFPTLDSDYDNCSVIGIVKFGMNSPYGSSSETVLGFYIEWVSETNGLYRRDIGFWAEQREISVIGNIFDNPELLEVGE